MRHVGKKIAQIHKIDRFYGCFVTNNNNNNYNTHTFSSAFLQCYAHILGAVQFTVLNVTITLILHDVSENPDGQCDVSETSFIHTHRQDHRFFFFLTYIYFFMVPHRSALLEF